MPEPSTFPLAIVAGFDPVTQKTFVLSAATATPCPNGVVIGEKTVAEVQPGKSATGKRPSDFDIPPALIQKRPAGDHAMVARLTPPVCPVAVAPAVSGTRYTPVTPAPLEGPPRK